MARERDNGVNLEGPFADVVSEISANGLSVDPIAYLALSRSSEGAMPAARAGYDFEGSDLGEECTVVTDVDVLGRPPPAGDSQHGRHLYRQRNPRGRSSLS